MRKKINKDNIWAIVVSYFIFGFLWIFFSDSILALFVHEINMYENFQTFKGLLYILITSFLIYYLIVWDHTKLSKLSDELVAQKKFLYGIYNSSNTAIMVWKLNGEVIEVNNRFVELVGYTSDEFVGRKWIEVIIKSDERPILVELISKIISGQQFLNYETRIFTKGRTILTMLWNHSLMQSPINDELIVVSFGVDITKEKKQERELLKMAYTDILTGLPNREAFTLDVSSLITEEIQFTIYFIDIDNFKRLNDIHGHEKGDIFLKQYSEVLNKNKEKFNVYRWGGDEFMIVEQTTSEDKIKETIRLLKECSNKKWYISNIKYYASISFGIVRFPYDGYDFSTLQKNIDMALHKAKDNGKARYEFYYSEFQKEVEYRSNLEMELNKAIKDNSFELMFQPIFNLNSGCIDSIEALLRWNNQINKNITTGEFIAFAEQSGQIYKIDKWVVRSVLKQFYENSIFEKNCTVSINISAQSFNSEDFCEFLRDQIEIFELDTNFIELEITEHSFLDDLEKSVNRMNSLKSMGFKIALDDFGTKYSTLNYLGKLPFDKLKIDKSYIDNVLDDENARIIVDQIIQLSNKLGIKTVAEGIEFPAQSRALLEYGCNYGQGYYFSKPVKMDSILKMMDKQK